MCYSAEGVDGSMSVISVLKRCTKFFIAADENHVAAVGTDTAAK